MQLNNKDCDQSIHLNNKNYKKSMYITIFLGKLENNVQKTHSFLQSEITSHANARARHIIAKSPARARAGHPVSQSCVIG